MALLILQHVDYGLDLCSTQTHKSKRSSIKHYIYLFSPFYLNSIHAIKFKDQRTCNVATLHVWGEKFRINSTRMSDILLSMSIGPLPYNNHTNSTLSFSYDEYKCKLIDICVKQMFKSNVLKIPKTLFWCNLQTLHKKWIFSFLWWGCLKVQKFSGNLS